MATIEEKLAALDEKRKQLLKAKAKRDSLQRAQDSKKARAAETRKKILVGAIVMGRVEKGTWPEDKFRLMLDEHLEADHDRELFGFPPRSKNEPKATSAE